MTRYAEMLPVLQAQEALQAIAGIAVGTGSVKPLEARAILATFHRLAAGNQKARRLEGSVREAALATMGIAVERRKPKVNHV